MLAGRGDDGVEVELRGGRWWQGAPQAHQPGTGAVREGAALLQGLATCGTCGRKLAVFYRGPGKSTPGYYCQGSAELVDGRGARHLHATSSPG